MIWTLLLIFLGCSFIFPCLFVFNIWLHQVLVGAFLVAQLVKNLPEIWETSI